MDEGPPGTDRRRADRESFDRVAGPLMPMLRAYILRMVAHPEDADELLQETLLKAPRGWRGFRGESSVKTWLFSIATRTCLDHLRARKRWPVQAQIDGAREAQLSPEVMGKIHAAIAEPDFVYDVGQHIAYCFTCIGRTLEPECCAALLLREVFELGNREAARVMGISESKLRHRLSSARREMAAAFAGVCALVGKGGVCHQCDGLRAVCPEPRQGPSAAEFLSSAGASDLDLAERLAIVARAGVERGSSAGLHDYLLRFMSGRPAVA